MGSNTTKTVVDNVEALKNVLDLVTEFRGSSSGLCSRLVAFRHVLGECGIAEGEIRVGSKVAHEGGRELIRGSVFDDVPGVSIFVFFSSFRLELLELLKEASLKSFLGSRHLVLSGRHHGGRGVFSPYKAGLKLKMSELGQSLEIADLS